MRGRGPRVGSGSPKSTAARTLTILLWIGVGFVSATLLAWWLPELEVSSRPLDPFARGEWTELPPAECAGLSLSEDAVDRRSLRYRWFGLTATSLAGKKQDGTGEWSSLLQAGWPLRMWFARHRESVPPDVILLHGPVGEWAACGTRVTAGLDWASLRVLPEPSWLGLLANSALFAVVLFLIWVAVTGLVRRIVKSVSVPPGACPRCRYPLGGLTRCPECGYGDASP